jgi:hypothetical protein
MIGAAVIGAIDSAHEILTEESPPAPVERAEINGGAWGPSRVLYRCRPDGQCIAPDHVVFDSIANDPLIGNEAYFMGAKILGSHDWVQSTVYVKIGDTVLVRALIENDAAMNMPHSQSLVAHNTRFRLSIPTNSGSELPLLGHISATNAVPQIIYDTVFLRSKKRFAIEYDWGSTILANQTHEMPLSDDIVGEGTLVGPGAPDGIFPPGLSNNAAVFFLVHVVSPTA